MPKPLYIIIAIIGLLFLAKPAAAGIIIRPVINTGLVGYWSFNEGTGTKVGDMSGNGQNCTWAGSGSHWGEGKFGRGGNIIATDDETSCGTNDIYNFTGNFTVSAWFRFSSLPFSNGYIYLAGRADHDYYLDAGEKGYYLLVARDGGAVPRFVFNVGGASASTNATYAPGDGISPGIWHHAIGVKRGDDLLLYVDGVLVHQNNQSFGDMSASGQTFYAGSNYSASSVDVQIDEVRVYNRDLDASEITKLYESGLSRIGINQLGLVPDDLPANATVSYIREDCTGYSPCYDSLFHWEEAFGGFGWDGCTTGDLTCLNKTAVAKIDGVWNSPDATAVAIEGWTTDATRYIKIYTTASARHPGKWDETKYRMERTFSSGATLFNLAEEYVRVDGLQFKVSNSAATSTRAILSYVDNVNSAFYLSNNIILAGTIDAGTAALRGLDGLYSASQNNYVWNNIFYDFTTGSVGEAMVNSTGTGYTKNLYAYNNTIVNCYRGFFTNDTRSPIYAKNNIVKGSGDTNAYAGGGTYDASTDYNATDGTDTTGQGAHSRISQQFGFVSEARDDFHLTAGDPGARNYGADLSNDTNISFSTDIDRQTRTAQWDIGADEARGTIANASQNNQLTNGLVGFWSFNGPDIDGNTAYDRSTSGNNGTITGVTKINGKVGQALSFAGDNTTRVSINSNIIGTGANTICAWVNSDEMGMMQLISIDSPFWFGFFRPETAYQVFISNDGTGTLAVSAEVISINRWVHVCGIRYADNTATLYIDGIQSGAAKQNAGTISSPTSSLVIGSADGTVYDFSGKIDEVRIYNRVLEPGEIQRLYNLGR